MSFGGIPYPVWSSPTQHMTFKKDLVFVFSLLPANLWGAAGYYIEGTMRNHTAGNLYLLNLIL